MNDRNWQLAQRICTPKELDALALWRAGAGYNRIADLLTIHRSVARDRVRDALRKIRQHPDYHQEAA